MKDGRGGTSYGDMKIHEKRRWHTSVAAIVRRSYDLGLIGAAEYRRHCQYISFKGWTKGEPAEPNFQDPELLPNALEALGKKIDLTVNTFCSDLHFEPQTFKEVTGVDVPPIQTTKAEVIAMEMGLIGSKRGATSGC